MNALEEHTEAMRRRRAAELEALRLQNAAFRERLNPVPVAPVAAFVKTQSNGPAVSQPQLPNGKRSVRSMVESCLKDWDPTQPTRVLRKITQDRYPEAVLRIQCGFPNVLCRLRHEGRVPRQEGRA